MALYPASLLPQKTYPVLANEEIAPNALVRETMAGLYALLEKKGCTPDDDLRFIVAPQPSLREVFESSLFLYGYYDERHCGIRVHDAALYAGWTEEQEELAAEDIQFIREALWPLFLAARKLDRQAIFSHKPACANYWHGLIALDILLYSGLSCTKQR